MGPIEDRDFPPQRGQPGLGWKSRLWAKWPLNDILEAFPAPSVVPPHGAPLETVYSVARIAESSGLQTPKLTEALPHRGWPG